MADRLLRTESDVFNKSIERVLACIVVGTSSHAHLRTSRSEGEKGAFAALEMRKGGSVVISEEVNSVD